MTLTKKVAQMLQINLIWVTMYYSNNIDDCIQIFSARIQMESNCRDKIFFRVFYEIINLENDFTFWFYVA